MTGSCKLNSLKFISKPATISSMELFNLYDLLNLLMSLFLNSFSFRVVSVIPLQGITVSNIPSVKKSIS